MLKGSNKLSGFAGPLFFSSLGRFHARTTGGMPPLVSPMLTANHPAARSMFRICSDSRQENARTDPLPSDRNQALKPEMQFRFRCYRSLDSA